MLATLTSEIIDDSGLLPGGRRVPVLDEDEDTVTVNLSNNDTPAIIDRVDFERLMAMGVSDQWHMLIIGSHRYVRCRTPLAGHEKAIVARLIMGSPEGQVVRYLDSNPLNLRRSNLHLDYRSAYWKAGPSALKRRERTIYYQRAGA